MNILFHSNQLGIRGTEVALFDYAHYNETILGNSSYIAAPINSDMGAYEKFLSRFGSDKIILYNDFNDISSSVSKKYNISVAYFIKAGVNDGKLIQGVKNIVHVVFQHYDPHGDKYVYIAEWLADKMSNGSCEYLPHILKMEDHNDNYRNHLSIPDNAIVFGRHGGYDEFNLEYTHNAIIQAAINNNNLYFLFMNTRPLSNHNIHNIIYLDSSTDLEIKRAFINTCDCMIHGRKKGEVFSLSMGEFLYCNKPVITSIEGEDRGHLYMLKDNGIYYDSAEELFSILMNFQKKNKNMYKLVSEYSPENIMSKFNNIINN